jgi:hypothetical protein
MSQGGEQKSTAERGRAENAERFLSFSNSQIKAASSAQPAPETLQTLTSADPLFSQPSQCSSGGCSGIATIRRTGQLGHCCRAGESSCFSIDGFSSARPEQSIRPISSTPPERTRKSTLPSSQPECSFRPCIHRVSDYSPDILTVTLPYHSHTFHRTCPPPLLNTSAPTISSILPQSTTLSFHLHLHLCCNSALIKFIQH